MVGVFVSVFACFTLDYFDCLICVSWQRLWVVCFSLQVLWVVVLFGLVVAFVRGWFVSMACFEGLLWFVYLCCLLVLGLFVLCGLV